MVREVFITGGTGYMGRRLIRRLVEQGYLVKALVRPGSERKLPPGCIAVIADPFNEQTFAADIPAGATFIQLLGVPHPSPKKKALFPKIDLASAQASARAAQQAGAGHFVYVSVAQTPTGVMPDYQYCRAAGEAAIRETGIPATFLRPWYVIGPGHYWPLLLLPVFKVLEWIPATAAKARALRLVTLRQMLQGLIRAVEQPEGRGVHIMEIAELRKL